MPSFPDPERTAVDGQRCGEGSARLVLALTAGLLAQYAWTGPPRNLGSGFLLYLVAVVLFWPLARCAPSCLTHATSQPDAGPPKPSRLAWTTGAWGAAAAACGLCLWAVSRQRNDLAVLCWAASGLAALIAARASSVIPVRRPASGRGGIAIVGLTAVALGLRLVALASVPALLAGDEAAMGLEGQRVLSGALRNWFGTGWFSHPSLYFVLLAASQRLLGYSITALRVTSAVAGALTVPGLYLAVRRWHSVRVALIAAALLTTYHFHLHYSRLGLNNVWDALSLVGALYWLDRALEERQVWPWACLGIVLGLAQYGYWGSRALPLVVLGVVVWEVAGWGKARASVGWRWIGAVATLVLTTAPLAFHFVSHRDEWVFRFAQISILRSGWLAATAALQGVSALQYLAQHALRSVLAFHYYTDTSVLYGAPIPLLDFFMAVLAVFGAVALIRGANGRATLAVALSLVLVLVFGAMLLADPPASQRLVIVSPLVCLLAALGLDRLLSLAHNCFAVSRTLSIILLLVVVLAIGWGNVRYYFQVYTPGGYFLEGNSELVDRAGRYLRNLDRDISVFWAGAPRVYADAPTLLFLAPRAQVQDVAEFHWGLGENLLCPPAVFVFVPERLAELERWRSRCPGGAVVDFNGQDQALLFVAYELP